MLDLHRGTWSVGAVAVSAFLNEAHASVRPTAMYQQGRRPEVSKVDLAPGGEARGEVGGAQVKSPV